MMVGGKADQNSMFDGVIQYVWIHSADLDAVAAIETVEDLPAVEIRKLGLQIDFGEVVKFIHKYGESATRMQAALTEVEEEDAVRGKQPEQAPAGLHHLFLPSGALETPSGSDTFSGSCPSSAPSPISMLPTSQPEPPADGAANLMAPPMESTPPAILSQRCEENGKAD